MPPGHGPCKRQNTACAPRLTIRDEPDEHLLPAFHAAESIFELSVLVHSASVRAARMGLLAARRRGGGARAGPGVRQPRAPATHQLARHQDRVRELEPDGSLAPPVAWHLGCTTASERTLPNPRRGSNTCAPSLSSPPVSCCSSLAPTRSPLRLLLRRRSSLQSLRLRRRPSRSRRRLRQRPRPSASTSTMTPPSSPRRRGRRSRRSSIRRRSGRTRTSASRATATIAALASTPA